MGIRHDCSIRHIAYIPNVERRMKYIMIQAGTAGSTKQLIPIIFPDNLVHREMAECVIHTLRRNHKRRAVIRSAGFIALETTTCFGESESLNVKSHPEDSAVIKAYPYAHGLVFDRGEG